MGRQGDGQSHFKSGHFCGQGDGQGYGQSGHMKTEHPLSFKSLALLYELSLMSDHNGHYHKLMNRR